MAEPPKPGQPIFHNLVGEWLGLAGGNAAGYAVEEGYLAEAQLNDLASAKAAISETLDRGVAVKYPKNPWANAAGLELGDFLTSPMADVRNSVEKLIPLADALDKSASPDLPPLTDGDLPAQATTRRQLAELLVKL